MDKTKADSLFTSIPFVLCIPHMNGNKNKMAILKYTLNEHICQIRKKMISGAGSGVGVLTQTVLCRSLQQS